MEKLAAEEEDEQGEWHGAEANEFFLGRGANDELYLVELLKWKKSWPFLFHPNGLSSCFFYNGWLRKHHSIPLRYPM